MDKNELEIKLAIAMSQEAILRDELIVAEANYNDEIQRDADRTDGGMAQEKRREVRLEKLRNIVRTAKTALVDQTHVVSHLSTQLCSCH